MDDWDTLAIEALRSLGADTDMVPGAKLRQRMVELGRESGFDVAEYVANSADSFSTLVGRVANVDVQVRPGSDVLVGLHGSRVPSDTRQIRSDRGYPGLRKDVYEAFTRISRVPFVYLPGTDRFVPENEAEGTSIAVESVTLDGLVEDRRSFVGTLPLEDQQPLIDALNGSSNPLAEFRREATSREVLRQWASWQSQTVASRVGEWASRNGLTVRAAWLRRTGMADSPHQSLARLIPYLNADEIRDLRIPFRAIEALLSDQKE
ncbi:MAG: hypothetical protein OXC28_12375 [Defluviicoccus sp.]|nr:hypothetical protein [Defluviicoccus sp.]